MTNNLRDKIVKELENRFEGLNASLRLTEERYMASKDDSEEEVKLDAKANELAGELDDIDGVLRLLEAR